MSSIAELKAIRGSKYLQSRIEDTYHEAKKYLDSGSYVLFSGTGCQIAGLKSYLRKEYENLYTIDVLCHGVPSPAVWKRYLREQEQNYESSATEVSFRNKSHGWKNYCVKIKFANGKTYEQTFTDDVFMKLFLSDICLRPSCHDCRFKEFPRVSDLTLGDCWGVDVYFPEMDDDKGTSVVVVNTEKGKRLWDELKELCIWKGSDLDIILPPTSDSRKSVKKHYNREKFFFAFAKKADMRKLVRFTELTLLERLHRKCVSVCKICMKRNAVM